MKPNPGHLPPEAIGKRVRVQLVRGGTFEAPAEGRHAPIWTLRGDGFDIARFEVIG